MSNRTKLSLAYLCIGFYILYYFVVAGFLITGTDLLLTCWEIATIIGGIVVLLFLLSLLEHTDDNRKSWKLASIAVFGYAIGTPIICVQMIAFYKRSFTQMANSACKQ